MEHAQRLISEFLPDRPGNGGCLEKVATKIADRDGFVMTISADPTHDRDPEGILPRVRGELGEVHVLVKDNGMFRRDDVAYAKDLRDAPASQRSRDRQ